MSVFISGFVLSMSFILAIGAQNALILRQGIRREHVLLVVIASSVSELLLVGIGVVGFTSLSSGAPWILDVLRVGGAAFLFFSGAAAMISAYRGEDALDVSPRHAASWQSVLATTLGVTWLNPHAILDTAVLIGSISVQYGEAKYVFGIGAVTASVLFFFALGYGARFLAPLFTRPRARQGLDVLIALTMWTIAFGLIISR